VSEAAKQAALQTGISKYRRFNKNWAYLLTSSIFHRAQGKNIDFILLLILFIAAVVRYWGIDFGLPNTLCRPDENLIVSIAKSPLNNLHPGDFYYPSFYKYIVLFFYSIYFFVGLLIGKFSSIKDFTKAFVTDPSAFYLIDRYLSAFLGIATVFVCYLIAKKLFDRKIARISALFLGLAYIHVRDSHFGTVDVPVTFLIMCSVLFIIESYQNKILKNYIISGIFAGLAASTKYSGIFLFIPILAVHILNISELKERRENQFQYVFYDKRMWLFGIAFILAFLAGTPYALLDFSGFIKDLSHQVTYLNIGHDGVKLARGWWYHLRYSLPFGVGINLFIISVAGILVLIRKDLKKALILFSFPLVYYLYAGKGYTVFLRYIIPLIPFLCIAGAFLVGYVLCCIEKNISPNLLRVIMSLLLIFILLPSLYNIAHFNKLLTRKDNRVIAAEWINSNIEDSGSIAQFGSDYDYGKVQLYPSIESLKKEYEMNIRQTKRKAKYLQIMMNFLQENKIKGFNILIYDNAIKAFIYHDQKVGLPNYIILEKSPLKMYSMISTEQENILKKHYYILKSFEAININNRRNWFNQIDAFYIPFFGFKEIQRPGPNIYIYKKITKNSCGDTKHIS